PRGPVAHHRSMPIIDVHTHMFTRHWLELLRAHGGPYNVQTRPDGKDEIFRGETPVVFPQPAHFDYDERIRAMDAAGIDAVLSTSGASQPRKDPGPGRRVH